MSSRGNLPRPMYLGWKKGFGKDCIKCPKKEEKY